MQARQDEDEGEGVRRDEEERQVLTLVSKSGATKERRVGPAEYARQVRGELRKVAWPTRTEKAERCAYIETTPPP